MLLAAAAAQWAKNAAKNAVVQQMLDRVPDTVYMKAVVKFRFNSQTQIEPTEDMRNNMILMKEMMSKT